MSPFKNNKLRIAFAAAGLSGVMGLGTLGGVQHSNRTAYADATATSLTLPTQRCSLQAVEAVTAPPRLSAETRDVMIVPGFAMDDAMMAPLRDKLTAQGFRVLGWGAGTNKGPDAVTADLFYRHLEKAVAANGGKPIALVGYSLGGAYAYEMAQRHPALVRSVVTIAAPLYLDHRPVDPRIADLRSIFSQQKNSTSPLTPVPVTSIYSTEDLMINWQQSVLPPAPLRENIVASGGHVGLLLSGDVARMTGARLGMTVQDWQPILPAACLRRPSQS